MSSLLDLEKSGKLKNRSIRIHKYDPYQYPPNSELAEDHLIATRIAVPVEIEGVIDVDEATGLPVKNEKIPLCCNEDELNFLSPGYPMYYQFIKFCLVYTLLMFLISGVYNLYNNYKGSSCYTLATLPKPVRYSFLKQHCLKSFITQFTLANVIDDETSKDVQESINLCTIIALIFFMHYLRRIQRIKAIECDERAVTPSDYSIRAIGFPTSFPQGTDIDEEIKKWFEVNGLPGKKLDIRRVNLCYDIDEKMEIIDEIEEASLNVADLRHRKEEGELISDDEIAQMEKEIEEKAEKLEVINNEFRTGITDKFVGECYITFNTNEEMINVVDHWKLSASNRLKERFKNESIYKFQGHLLKVERAPEPSDIFWENAGISKKEKYRRRTLTLIGTILVIAFCFWLVYLCKIQKEKVVDEFASKDNKGTADVVAIRFLSNLGAIVIIMINVILNVVMEHMADYEKYSTLSEHQANFSLKLIFAQWFNTTIVSLLLALRTGNLWGPGGLVLGIYYVFQNNAILPIIFAIIDINYIPGFFKRIWYRFRKNKNIKMTQKQLNEVFEYPQFGFAERYAYYIKTICSAAFYAPLVPSCLIWALIGMSIKYWVDKIIMLRRRSRGGSISPQLPTEFIELLEIPIITFACGNLFFGMYAEEFDFMDLIPSMIGLALAIANAFLPMQKWNEKWFNTGYVQLVDETYEQKRLQFTEDYDRANPATGDSSLERYVKERQGVQSLNSIIKKSYTKKFNFNN